MIRKDEATQHKRSEWLQLILWLKETFPVNEPVSIRTIPLKNELQGSAYFNPETRRFEIKISKELPYVFRIFVLIHEWAHVITWHQAYARCMKKRQMESFHSKEWGIAYAKLYRFSLQWNYGRSGNHD